MVQLSHPYMNTGKTIALTIQAFVGKVVFDFKKIFVSNLMFIFQKINHPLKSPYFGKHKKIWLDATK